MTLKYECLPSRAMTFQDVCYSYVARKKPRRLFMRNTLRLD